ncbi:hypothetical protein Pint_14357 [Pistacia integerrima]|uniref:Uncharacterized protein n=2 Tax=Pistacia integerrima TaxID=434235 RepID=A0ACC0Y6Z2_9ROSI|nr:hypothetical protein Pint_14354 [Pistacia integerrima]KAJ0031081.1 hypothetical protein Pint_14357 [Pistacia integerrima]
MSVPSNLIYWSQFGRPLAVREESKLQKYPQLKCKWTEIQNLQLQTTNQLSSPSPFLFSDQSSLSQNQSTQPSSESDALRWKRKAKERKQDLIRLREDLREAEDSSHCDLFPQSASCKCCFFDRLGKLSPKIDGDASYRRFNDVLRRRFLRQVHFYLFSY